MVRAGVVSVYGSPLKFCGTAHVPFIVPAVLSLCEIRTPVISISAVTAPVMRSASRYVHSATAAHSYPVTVNCVFVAKFAPEPGSNWTVV